MFQTTLLKFSQLFGEFLLSGNRDLRNGAPHLPASVRRPTNILAFVIVSVNSAKIRAFAKASSSIRGARSTIKGLQNLYPRNAAFHRREISKIKGIEARGRIKVINKIVRFLSSIFFFTEKNVIVSIR